jgi:hypothetical protein
VSPAATTSGIEKGDLMKTPARTAVIAVVMLAIGAGAFFGGVAYQRAKNQTAQGAAFAPGARPGAGGFANLTEEERAQLESMTDEERRQWFEQRMGSAASASGAPRGGGLLQGEVIEVDGDALTVKVENGSEAVYTEDSTVIAYVEGAGKLAAGSNVMILATPTADEEVVTASLVVVTR